MRPNLRDLKAYAAAKALEMAKPLRPPRKVPPGGPRSHLVIPDLQIQPFVPIDHCEWIGEYIAERRPNVVIGIGDGADMPSLNRHASPREMEGSDVVSDLECWRDALNLLMRKMRAVKGYKPELHWTLGNHENRLMRAINDTPALRRVYGADPFGLKAAGWTVHPFLKPVTLDGVTYCHFFPRGANGKVTQSHRGAPSAATMVKREMKSCVAGHLQGLDVAIYHTGDRTIRGVIAGSCYLHEESYLTPQGNEHWHGILVFHEVCDGNFDVMEVSLDYLRRRYGGGRVLAPWVPKLDDE